MSTAVGATTPLNRPLYGATFRQAVSRFWRNYVNFRGRASGSEFWWATLFCAIVYFALQTLDTSLGGGGTPNINLTTGTLTWEGGFTAITVISYLWSLATLVPILSVAWRRLHDTNQSGAFVLMSLIPVAGIIVLIVFAAGRTHPAGARFDHTPAAGGLPDPSMP